MSKLISVSENGVIYVENDNGEGFGIVSSYIILDENGTKYQGLALDVLENNGFNLDQDWDNGSTYIDFFEENGETSRVVFAGGDASVIEVGA
jgi:hypothetical protein